MKKILMASLLLLSSHVLAYESLYDHYSSRSSQGYNSFSFNSNGVGSSTYNNGNGSSFTANSNGTTSQTWRMGDGRSFTVNSDGSTSSTYGGY